MWCFSILYVHALALLSELRAAELLRVHLPAGGAVAGGVLLERAWSREEVGRPRQSSGVTRRYVSVAGTLGGTAGRADEAAGLRHTGQTAFETSGRAAGFELVREEDVGAEDRLEGVVQIVVEARRELA